MRPKLVARALDYVDVYAIYVDEKRALTVFTNVLRALAALRYRRKYKAQWVAQLTVSCVCFVSLIRVSSCLQMSRYVSHIIIFTVRLFFNRL